MGSSVARSRNGSIQPLTVVKRPGSCSQGQVRVHISCEPVGCPKQKGATRRDKTVVFGTGSPVTSATSRPNALSPICLLYLLGQVRLSDAGALSDASYSHIKVCVLHQPRGF